MSKISLKAELENINVSKVEFQKLPTNFNKVIQCRLVVECIISNGVHMYKWPVILTYVWQLQ